MWSGLGFVCGLCEFWSCVGLRCVGFRGNFRVATLALWLACNVSWLNLLNATMICVDFRARISGFAGVDLGCVSFV